MTVCSQCQTPNASQANFCKSCGLSLKVLIESMCAACSEPLSAAAKFCRNCGTVAGAPAQPEIVDAAPEPVAYVAPVEVAEAAPVAPEMVSVPEPEPLPVAEPVAEEIVAAELAPVRKSPSPLWMAVNVLVFIALIGGAAYLWMKAKPNPPADVPAPVVQEPAPAAAAVVAAPSAPPAEPVVQPAPEPAPVAAPAPVRAAPVEVAPPVRHAPEPAAPQSDPFEAKVGALVNKAEGFLAAKQYDKAIATAEAALDLDPRSATARSVLARAKTRQTEALKSGSSIE